MKTFLLPAFALLLRLTIVVLTLFATVSLILTPVTQAQDVTEAHNRDSLLRIASDAFGQGNLSVLDEIFATDFTAHTPNGNHDREGAIATITSFRGAMPDVTLTPELVIAEGDFVAGRFILEGTFSNPLATPDGPIAPTGQRVRYALNTIQRYNEAGQAEEEWIAWDNLNLLTQLGVLPRPEGASPAEGTNDSLTEATRATDNVEMEAANRETLLRIADESFNAGNFERLEEFLAPDYVLHSPLGNTDRTTSKAIYEAMGAAMPDLELTREIIVSEGNWSGVRTVLRGTFTNDYATPIGVLPPTGQPIVLEVVNFFQFNDAGQVTEEWAEFDNLGFLTQLGAIPAPNTTDVALSPQESNPPSEETLMRFVERFDAIFEGPNLAIADEIYASEFVGHAPLAPELDRDGWKAYVESIYTAFPDLKQEVNQIIIGEDRLVLYVTYTGTHQGSFFGVPATGNQITMDGIGIFRFDDNGLVAENWAILDVVGLLAQIGAFPPEP
jgi:steroid delta-isomerase-like uncharacterized protein